MDKPLEGEVKEDKWMKGFYMGAFMGWLVTNLIRDYMHTPAVEAWIKRVFGG